MEDKKGMGMCREGGGCHGGCGDHWMSRGEHSIVRGFLYFFLLVFVFWIGLALGEMRAYLSNEGYGRMNPYMMQNRWGDQETYAPMMGRPGGYDTTPQSSPSSPKR